LIILIESLAYAFAGLPSTKAPLEHALSVK
jgi:hypothetical protein